jgi:hypothetical protein
MSSNPRSKQQFSSSFIDVAADVSPLIISPEKFEPTHVGCYRGGDAGFGFMKICFVCHRHLLSFAWLLKHPRAQ